MTYSYQGLFEFTRRVFEGMGCSLADAELSSKVLLAADLRGIDSHGLARLLGYVRLWEVGRVNAQPQMHIVHETPSTATINADAALGLVSAPYAMKVAIEKAKMVGSGWVAIKNSNHFGIAGYHAMMALEHDMIGFALTNASPLVAPTRTTERMLGTNPIALAIPAHTEPAFVADLATTTVSNGKLEILERKQQDAPEGWVQDASGQASTDATVLRKGGALLPLGSNEQRSSYKGYCLGSIVDIMSGVLSGAGFGPWAPPFVSFLPLPQDPVGEGLGHFVGAWRIDAFRPAEDFKKSMDIWIQRFRNAKPINPDEPVLIPGDPERLAEAERMQKGIPLIAPVIGSLKEAGRKFGLNFEEVF